MKTSEKILIGLVLFTFVLQALVVGIPTNFAVLSCLLLAGTYAIGGHIILNDDEKSENFLAITGGIVLASSIIILPFIIKLPWAIQYKIIPVFNILFCVGLGIYLFLKRKKNNNKVKKQIFIRSLVVMIITAFFAYPPSSTHSYSIYRTVIKALNRNNAIYNNMKMVDYINKGKESLEDNDCELAIKYGHKAKNQGFIWLGIEDFDLKDSTFIEQVQVMELVFSNLYKAHRCKGDNLYEKNEFEEALTFYQKADSFLVFNQHKSWNVSRIRATLDIANTLRKLKRYEQADSFYLKTFNRYQTLGDTSKHDLVALFQDFSESCTVQKQYSSANILLKKANILATNLPDAKQIKTKHYIYIAINYLQIDSLVQAKMNLDSLSNLITDQNPSFGIYLMIKGKYFYQKNDFGKASQHYLEALEKYNEEKRSAKNFAQLYYLLGKNAMALAKYEKVNEYVEEGISLISPKKTENEAEYNNLILLKAEVKFSMGKYHEAKRLYQAILQNYLNIHDDESYELVSIYGNLAEVETKLLNLDAAKNYADKSVLIANQNEFVSPSTTFYRNNAAYVNYVISKYRIADTLYNSTIRIHKEFNNNLSTELANAYNGLALIAFEKKQYKKADTLFLKSLKMNKTIFGDNHPNIATVQYNQALLLIHQKKYKEAETLLYLVYGTFTEYYTQNHDNVALVYLALAEIAKKENNKELAKQFFTKAYNILLVVFGDSQTSDEMMKLYNKKFT